MQAAIAHNMIRTLANAPNFIIAASNAYDHVYLRWTLGLRHVLPLPGTAPQLASARRDNEPR